jgi:hypothetical protein
MNDNVIMTGNTTTSSTDGGAVLVDSGGIFTMNGGSINGNTAASNNGGGVSVEGTFNMKGGTITGNTATNGAVFIGTNGTLLKSGGNIYGNIGDDFGKTGFTLKGWNTKKDWGGSYYTASPQGTAVYPVWSGNGSNTTNAKAITTLGELQDISSGPALYYGLAKDIVITGSWTAIGNNTTKFTGGFNGNGHTIVFDGFSPSISGTERYIGLFGFTGTGSNIKNLSVTGNMSYTLTTSVTTIYFGGIVGRLNGSISNCSVGNELVLSNTSTLTTLYMGGIAGYVESSSVLQNCYSIGGVSQTNSATSSTYIGGIVGFTNIQINYCYSMGTIKSTGSNDKLRGISAFNNTGSVRYSVALNDNLEGHPSANFGRIWQNMNPGTSNYGSSDMKKNGISHSWPNNGTAAQEDGLDVSLLTTQSSGWWTGTAGWSSVWGTSDTAPWQWGNGLPKLHWE